MDEWNHPFGGRFIVRDTDNVASYKAMGWSDSLFPCPVFDFQIVDELCLEMCIRDSIQSLGFPQNIPSKMI